MKLPFQFCLVISLAVLAMVTAQAQNSPVLKSALRIKLDNTFSFRNEKLSRFYTREGHRRGNMAISPDSRYFLGKIDNSTVSLLDLHSGETRTLSVSHDVDYTLFSRNSRSVAVFDDVGDRKTVSILSLERGKLLVIINSPEKIGQIAFSPDNERIATSTEEVKLVFKGKNVVRLWNADDGSLLSSINGCADFMKAPAFSANGQILLVDCKSKHKPTKVFNAKTGQELHSFAKKYKFGNAELWSDIVPESILSPDSKTIVSIVRFSGIRLWDVESGILRAEFNASQGSVNRITFGPDGKSFATNGFSPVVRLWDTETGDLIRAFQTDITKSPAFMVEVEISPDGKTMAGIDKRGRITVWDIETAKVKFTLNEVAKKEDFSVRVFFGLNGQVLYFRSENSIKAVDAQTGKVFSEIPNPTGLFYISDDGRRVFIQDTQGIMVWGLHS